ncbi:unnamed protein product [Closterium sp. NIES-54]
MPLSCQRLLTFDLRFNLLLLLPCQPLRYSLVDSVLLRLFRLTCSARNPPALSPPPPRAPPAMGNCFSTPPPSPRKPPPQQQPQQRAPPPPAARPIPNGHPPPAPPHAPPAPQPVSPRQPGAAAPRSRFCSSIPPHSRYPVPPHPPFPPPAFPHSPHSPPPLAISLHLPSHPPDVVRPPPRANSCTLALKHHSPQSYPHHPSSLSPLLPSSSLPPLPHLFPSPLRCSSPPPPPEAAGGYPLHKRLAPGVYNYQEVQAATHSFSTHSQHLSRASKLSLPPPFPPPPSPLPRPPSPLALLSAAPPPPPAAAGGYPLRKSLSPGVVSQYNYQEVQAATQSFSTEIGRGGFGVVFHGRLADPQGGPPHEVAVKLMAEDHITNGIDSFITEVGVMARVHHPNILRLEGYVVGATPILIYDYVSMGDVSTYLAKAARGEVSFTWKQRVAVALGCAEALTTIHANNFVHRDFKATNVLLRQVGNATMLHHTEPHWAA